MYPTGQVQTKTDDRRQTEDGAGEANRDRPDRAWATGRTQQAQGGLGQRAARGRSPGAGHHRAYRRAEGKAPKTASRRARKPRLAPGPAAATALLTLFGAALVISRAVPYLVVDSGHLKLLLGSAVLLAVAGQAVALWLLIWTFLAWVATRAALPASIATRLRQAVDDSGSATAKAILQRATAASAIAGTSLVGSMGIANAAGPSEDLLWDAEVETTSSAPVEDLLWFGSATMPAAQSQPEGEVERPDSTDDGAHSADALSSPSAAFPGINDRPMSTATEGTPGAGQETLGRQTPGSDRSTPTMSTYTNPDSVEDSPNLTGARREAPTLGTSEAGARRDSSSQRTSSRGTGKHSTYDSSGWNGTRIPWTGESGIKAQATDPETEGGRSAETYLVVPGDCLWNIAKNRLPVTADSSQVEAAWRAIYELNRELIGSDPDQIEPGQVLVLPEEALH